MKAEMGSMKADMTAIKSILEKLEGKLSEK